MNVDKTAFGTLAQLILTIKITEDMDESINIYKKCNNVKDEGISLT